MEKIQVKKETVLEILRKNKETHRTEFEEAMTGWIEEAKKKLTGLLYQLNSNKASEVKFEVYLPKPVSYEKEYEKAIKMVEFEIRDTIEISNSDFERYFLDEWAWKESFLSNTRLYKNR
jgi:hypothetical protein